MMESNINKVNQYMRMGERMLNTHSSVPNPIANLGEIGKILKNRNEKYGNKKKITNP